MSFIPKVEFIGMGGGRKGRGNMPTWNKLSCHSLGVVYGGQYVHVE